MYAMRGQASRRGAASAMSPPSTVTLPCCICLEPATSASSVDLPTPSGPITPTMRPLGMSSERPSSASVGAIAMGHVLDRHDRRADGRDPGLHSTLSFP